MIEQMKGARETLRRSADLVSRTGALQSYGGRREGVYFPAPRGGYFPAAGVGGGGLWLHYRSSRSWWGTVVWCLERQYRRYVLLLCCVECAAQLKRVDPLQFDILLAPCLRLQHVSDSNRKKMI